MTSRSLDDGPMTSRRALPAILLSLLLHGVAYASLHEGARKEHPTSRKTELRFEVVSARKPVSPVEPDRAPEPPQPPKARAKLARAAAPERPAPIAPPTAAPPVEAPPSTGVTLTGDAAGNAFSVALGNGGSLEPGARPEQPAPVNVPAPTRQAPSPVPSEPPLVPASDLSRRPTAPGLVTALERYYPADARRRGLSGSAKVRARIDADGVVRRVILVEESGGGFGAACSRALTGSRWGAPQDKSGRSVATEIRYTCRFVVEP
jgi:TonB family protein